MAAGKSPSFIRGDGRWKVTSQAVDKTEGNELTFEENELTFEGTN